MSIGQLSLEAMKARAEKAEQEIREAHDRLDEIGAGISFPIIESEEKLLTLADRLRRVHCDKETQVALVNEIASFKLKLAAANDELAVMRQNQVQLEKHRDQAEGERDAWQIKAGGYKLQALDFLARTERAEARLEQLTPTEAFPPEDVKRLQDWCDMRSGDDKAVFGIEWCRKLLAALAKAAREKDEAQEALKTVSEADVAMTLQSREQRVRAEKAERERDETQAAQAVIVGALITVQHDLNTSEGLYCTDIEKDMGSLDHAFTLSHTSPRG